MVALRPTQHGAIAPWMRGSHHEARSRPTNTRQCRRIKRLKGVRHLPPLTVPSQLPPGAEPDLRAPAAADALGQFRPESLNEVGQPHPNGASPKSLPVVGTTSGHLPEVACTDVPTVWIDGGSSQRTS